MDTLPLASPSAPFSSGALKDTPHLPQSSSLLGAQTAPVSPATSYVPLMFGASKDHVPPAPPYAPFLTGALKASAAIPPAPLLATPALRASFLASVDDDELREMVHIHLSSLVNSRASAAILPASPQATHVPVMVGESTALAATQPALHPAPFSPGNLKACSVFHAPPYPPFISGAL